MFDFQARQDFERAVVRSFWRKVLARLTGTRNDLLPFDEVRSRLKIRGQHYIGLREVPIDAIAGSLGRYNDFDRAFLPTQARTMARWVSIDKAHYADIPLPPVELFKVGEVYFVKDGNHRISVARERGQVFIDAHVIEIEVPLALTPDLNVDELELEQERAEFREELAAASACTALEFRARQVETYRRLREHISRHRWYLGLERKAEVAWVDAAASWCQTVYSPLVVLIEEHNLARAFSKSGEAELYVWISEYQGYLRTAYQAGESSDGSRAQAAAHLLRHYPQPEVQNLIAALQREGWLDEMILKQENRAFMEQTRLEELRPEIDFDVSLPGQYGRLLQHISAHRWYLGEQRRAEAPYAEAVASWVDHVYLPLVEVIREQKILDDFPGRTETDMYLWIIGHLWFLRETYGKELSLEEAAEQVRGEHGKAHSLWRKLFPWKRKR